MDRLLGAWLVLDAAISLWLYVGRPGETWRSHHSIRVVRGLIGVWYLVKGWRKE